MSNTAAIAIELATPAICAAGICVMFSPSRALGWRILLVGAVIAAASATMPTQAQSGSYATPLVEMMIWIGVAGLTAAVFGARHLAARFIMVSRAVLAVAMVLPVLQPLMILMMDWWWLVPAILIAPFVTMFVVTHSLKGFRAHTLGIRADNSFRRFFIRVVDQLSLRRPRRRRRDRQISGAPRPRQKTGDRGRR